MSSRNNTLFLSTSSPASTLLSQLSGYGAKESLVQQTLEDLDLGAQSIDFMSWDKGKLEEFVGRQAIEASNYLEFLIFGVQRVLQTPFPVRERAYSSSENILGLQ